MEERNSGCSWLLAAGVLALGVACGSEPAETPPEPTPEVEAAEVEPTPEQAPALEEEAPEEAATALTMGGSAPMAETEMRGVDDEMHSIAGSAKEHGTLVVFTCNHCPYAIAWQERLTALAHEYQERGVGVIAINSNDPAEYPIDNFEGMQERATELSIAYPYVVDGTSAVARAFGAEKTPEAYLFNAEGELVYHGAIDDSQDPATIETHYLRDALQAVVDGEAVATAETPAVGCTIKFYEDA